MACRAKFRGLRGRGLPAIMPLMRPGRFARVMFWVLEKVTALFDGPVPLHWLTIAERESGDPRSVTVGLYEVDGRTYIVNNLPSHGWTDDVRASGRGTLTTRRTDTSVTLTEVTDSTLKQQVAALREGGTPPEGFAPNLSRVPAVFEVTPA